MPPALVDLGSAKDTFGVMCRDFNISDPVRDHIIAVGMTSLDDFRFYFGAESEVPVFVAAAGLKDADANLQVSRVRAAWTSLRRAASEREASKSAAASTELDDLLPDELLLDTRSRFWGRYRMRYPSYVMPSDALMSRCYREVDKRLLSVYCVWRVRSLMHQVTSSKKRKRVGTDLYLIEDERDLEPTHTAEHYLELLFIYLLALALVGAKPLAKLPTAREGLATESVDYVAIPWDVLQLYYFRASRAAQSVPVSQRLTWLERVDTEERSVWVSDFRDSERTLGDIVQATYKARDPHWTYVSSQQPASTVTTLALRPPQQAPARQVTGPKGKGGTKGRQPSRNRWAHTMANGQPLCAAFQRNECTGPGPCANGAHKCAKTKPNGRVCGGNHPASTCRRY